MNLTEILSKGNVHKGSRVVMMPAFYGHDYIGNALMELGATGIFVDHNDEILDRIRALFPEFEVRKGDALSFNDSGITTTVHYRPMQNYVYETIRPNPNAEMVIPGFNKMLQNIYRLSPNFVLFSVTTDLSGKVDASIRTEEMNAMRNAGFKVIEEGKYKDRQVSRYMISTR